MKRSVELFQIPLKDGNYIIYAPLKKIAFIGNKKTVELIEVMQEKGITYLGQNEAAKLICRTGILNSDVFPYEKKLRKYSPNQAVLLLTTKCNFRCVYCYAKSGDLPVQNMTLNLALRAINVVMKNAKEMNLNEFSLSFHGGGEPTANWLVLKDSVLYARKQNIKSKITLATNGCFSDYKAKFICNYFSGASLSFDGIEEVQNAQRPLAKGGGSFEKVMQTIKIFDAHNFSYGIRLTAAPYALDKIVKSVSFICQETSAKIIQIEPCFSEGRGVSNRLDDNQLKRFAQEFIEAYKIAFRYGRRLFYSGAKLDILNRFCSASRNALIVMPTGEVSACFEVCSPEHPLAKEFVFGKLTKDKLTVDKKKWQKIANANVFDISDCKDCFCRWHCAGDCEIKKGKYGRCFVAQEITKNLLLEKIYQNKGVWCGNV